jgi:predicted MPP superfamily phosphohydrolase
MTFYPLVFIVAALHAFVGWRLGPELAAPWGWVLGVGLVLSAVLMPLGLLGSRVLRQPWADRLSWVGLLLMGLFSSLLVLTALRDALLLAAWAVAALGLALPLASLRTLTGQATPLLALAVTALGLLNARRTATVVRIDVPIAGLPAALHGFTLAQISDIHVGPTIKQAYLQRIVTTVNALGADVVAITGDLVDGKVAELGAHVAPLAGLQSRHGTFFVTGNHEYYSGAHAWIVELRRLGLTVLMNEHVVLHHRSGQGLGMAVDAQEDSPTVALLVLAGVADYSAHHFDPTHRSDPALALLGAPTHALVRVLLAHQPRSAAAAELSGFDLQLSGTRMAGSFGRGICWCRCSSRLLLV